ncbi:Galactose-1-phosphate uridylyltransferase [Fragariocoptes setiger]|uniref:Galactose-1-phosphate uridylyltransferase n=1 Tax=Fragariocoptes setiger TaxID=1670756 RepID=A0ABQ7S6V8_9ACAR|nr:Galactose-1-phosphate uridylyltransferase [Fragariocoptes setiger]
MSPKLSLEFQDRQHRRYNILKDRWVLVCPHRTQRPWQGQQEKVDDPNAKLQSDVAKDNPLMPNAVRSSGQENPNYKSTFVFDNDFPALTPLEQRQSANQSSKVEQSDADVNGNYVSRDGSKFSGPQEISIDEIDEDCGLSQAWRDKSLTPHSLLKVSKASGRCRVICFTPDPNYTIPMMRVSEVSAIIQAWISQQIELGKMHKWVQIFENRGNLMGCSNPHPHCQVWASDFLPNEPKILNRTQLRYYQKFKSPMLLDYLQQELESGERIIKQNASWVAIVPFWAVWPFEAMVVPKRHIQRMQDTRETEKCDLAVIIQSLVTKFDNLFKCTFPYSMGWYGAPTGEYLDHDMSHWVCHCSFNPPLLRSATVKKFMVGYEMFAEEQRDLTPERAAQLLRETSEVHFQYSSST